MSADNMTDEQETVLLIRGSIASLEEADQAVVSAAYADIMKVLKARGPYSDFAVALIGAELAAKE